jgi:hypothetical protein
MTPPPPPNPLLLFPLTSNVYIIFYLMSLILSSLAHPYFCFPILLLSLFHPTAVSFPSFYCLFSSFFCSFPMILLVRLKFFFCSSSSLFCPFPIPSVTLPFFCSLCLRYSVPFPSILYIFTILILSLPILLLSLSHLFCYFAIFLLSLFHHPSSVSFPFLFCSFSILILSLYHPSSPFTILLLSYSVPSVSLPFFCCPFLPFFFCLFLPFFCCHFLPLFFCPFTIL